MKFESYESDRHKWVNDLAREWMRSGICLDLTVTCGAGDAERKSFQCHKILLLSFLKQYCPLECLEDVEEVLLPDTDPLVFEEYLKIEYGLDTDISHTGSSSIPVKVKLEEDNRDEEDFGNLDEDDYYEEDVGNLDEESDIKEDGVISISFTRKENVPSSADIVPIQCRICYKVYNIRNSNSFYKTHFLKMHPDRQ